MIFIFNIDKIILVCEFLFKGDVYIYKVYGIFFYMYLYKIKGIEIDSKKILSI